MGGVKISSLFLGLAFLVIVTAEGWGAEEVYVLWGDPQAGREVFVKKGCRSCHAIRGVGGKEGPDLGRPPARHRTLSQYAGILWNHAPEMRKAMQQKGIPWRPFEGPEMQDLLTYLVSIQLLDDPGDPKRGEQLFTAKGCASCHAIGGVGPTIGPDLSRWRRYASPILWAEIMWRHGPAMQERMERMGKPWPRFTDHEIVDLVAYLHQAARPPAER